MSITQNLFERWKATRGITSNREAMRVLGLSPTANIHWQAGRNADADIIERMARDLGENSGALVAQAMAEQTKGEAARTWARIAKQLGAAAALVLAVALPYDAKAATAPQAEQSSACTLCAIPDMERRLIAPLRPRTSSARPAGRSG